MQLIQDSTDGYNFNDKRATLEANIRSKRKIKKSGKSNNLI